MLASDWYHAFTPTASNLVAIATILVLVVGFISGWRSTIVRPHHDGLPRRKGEPRFYGKKIAQVKKTYAKEFAENELTASTLKFCSTTTDFLMSLAVGVGFALLFYAEHYYGLVQAIINITLAPNEGAAWGDFIAMCIIVCLGVSAGAFFFVMRCFGQHMKAKKIIKEYDKLGVRPSLAETPNFLFIVVDILWLIADEIEQHQARRRAKKRRKAAGIRKATL